MERSTMLKLGKSTISTGPFSIATLNYQRVYGDDLTRTVDFSNMLIVSNE